MPVKGILSLLTAYFRVLLLSVSCSLTFLCKTEIVFLRKAGIGAPIRPAFSIILPSSVRMYQTRTNGVIKLLKLEGKLSPN